MLRQIVIILNYFDPSKFSPFSMYFSFNSQSGHALSEPIPYCRFGLVEDRCLLTTVLKVTTATVK